MPIPTRSGLTARAADERHTGEDRDEREEPATRQALAADHRGDPDDEHEVRVVHERGERRRRPLERAVEERRVEGVDDGAERARRANAAPRGTRDQLRAGDADEEGGRCQVAPGEDTADRRPVRVGDLDQDRRDRERHAGREAEGGAAEAGSAKTGHASNVRMPEQKALP